MKKNPHKFHPTFKIDSNPWRAIEILLIASFLKEASPPQFHPSLRDFTDNSDILRTVGKVGGAVQWRPWRPSLDVGFLIPMFTSTRHISSSISSYRSSSGRIQGLGFRAHRDSRLRFRLPHLLFAIMAWGCIVLVGPDVLLGGNRSEHQPWHLWQRNQPRPRSLPQDIIRVASSLWQRDSQRRG
jgi:hypothetical protein